MSRGDFPNPKFFLRSWYFWLAVLYFWIAFALGFVVGMHNA